jgi:transposase InsO family protein
MSDASRPSSEALFRFSVLSQVFVLLRAGEERSEAVRTVAVRGHAAVGGGPSRRVSERTIYRWLAAYDDAGITGLEPKSREASASTVLSPAFVEYLVAEKRLDPRASIPELMRRARELGIVGPLERVDRSTVYRTCKRLGLSLARRKGAKDRDSRRFAFPHRMDMVLCDGKHFRAGAARLRRVALFFIDDATRCVLHTVVGTVECKQLFLRGLLELIVKHGYPSAVYVDRGPGFIAEDTIAVLFRLEIPLLHGEAGYKEGRGKIERFNRTVKADVLRALDGRPDVDPSCSALELRLRHYTDEVYAHRPHESLALDTPWQRFHSDPKALRFPEDEQALAAKFEVWLERRVSADHVVSVDAIDYEVPRGCASQTVVLRRRVLDGAIGFLHEGKLVELLPVDLASNARSPRARGERDRDDDTQPIPPMTAADLSFQRDFGPVVTGDGGLPFPDPDPDIDPESTERLPW